MILMMMNQLLKQKELMINKIYKNNRNLKVNLKLK